jgi:outer membrane biosynthesis protein TonB
MNFDDMVDVNDRGQLMVPMRLNALRSPPYLLGGVVALLLAGAVYAIVSNFLSSPPPKMKQVVHQISLLPPPPPPQLDQPPPEIKEEVKMSIPDPVAKNDAPPPGDIGVDADGNGADGFQLRARKGGRSLLDGGGPFAWYASRIQDSIYKILSANKKVRSANYAVTVRLWLGHDGSIERFELANTTGNPELDQSIKLALAKVGPLGNELPADMPQPVRLQIVSRQ